MLLFAVDLLLYCLLQLLLVRESVIIVHAFVSSLVVAATGMVRMGIFVCSAVLAAAVQPPFSRRAAVGGIRGLIRGLVIAGGFDVLLLLLLLMIVGSRNDRSIAVAATLVGKVAVPRVGPLYAPPAALFGLGCISVSPTTTTNVAAVVAFPLA